MGDEFEDTSVDTGSDVDTSSDSGESFDDSSMDAGDEAIEDSGSEGLDDSGDSGMDDSGESFEDSSMDAGDEPIDDSGAEGLDDSDVNESADESSEATDDGATDLPDGDAEGTDNPVDESGEATDDGANDLPDGAAEGTDEPVDESGEATDEGANDLPNGDAEGTDEPADENGEATDDGANDLPDGDAERTDEPVDENSEAADDGANDLPDGDAEGTDNPVDESSEAADDGANDLPDGDAEGTDEPADESAEATDDGATDLPDGDAEGTDGPADESGEATDDGANDLPDGDAEGTDEPVDESSEATDDGANNLPDGDTEGTDEPVDESSEANDDGASDHSNDEWDVDSGLSDAERAKNDLDYANEQYDIYKDNVANGIQDPNAEMEQGLQDAVNYAQGHYDDVTNGAPYSYNKPSDYWRSDEGRAVSGAMGKGMSKMLSQTGMGKDPTGNVDNAMSSFAQEAMPHIADGSQKLMENTYNQYATPGDKYMQEHFMRDANGTPITAAEGKEIAHGRDSSTNIPNDVNSKMTPEQADDVKNRIRESQQQRAEHPSGYRDFDQGKTNILTNEPTKLSSKNFDRLAEERGLSPEEAANQKYSMNEYQRPDPSLNGAEHHPDKSPDDYATARHILEPEQVYNYNNGVPRDGYEHAASGIYQTPEIQSAPNRSEQAAAQENLALPQSNDARVRSDSTLNPTLDNGKQHNIIEGTAAPQNTESVNDAFKADDGLDRHGGGKQIITDGGYNSGAVTEGDQHNVGDMNTDLNNPHLFDNHPAGEYGYTNASDGKSGFGQLDNSQKGIRDSNAQRMAGGSDRRTDDDGGHYIANMFNGDSGSKNLDPQNRNLNRGEWKAMENNQNSMLNNGDKVFTNNRSTKMDGSDRPDSYDAYTIVEHPDGSREAFPYHFKNESNKK